MERGGARDPFSASMEPWWPASGDVLRVRRGSTLNRPQRTQRRQLRLGHSSDPRDIESFVRPVTPQRPYIPALLQTPQSNRIVVPATGQRLPVGTHLERLDPSLMLLPKRQALPMLHVPPAHGPIAAATDQHRSGWTPDQRVHDRVRLAQGLQALPTLRIPDDELPAAFASATTGQSRAIGAPGYAHDCATMPLELLEQRAVGGLPQAHAAIIAATGQPGAIRTPRHTTNPGWLRPAHPPAGAGGHLPHMHPLLIARTG